MIKSAKFDEATGVLEIITETPTGKSGKQGIPAKEIQKMFNAGYDVSVRGGPEGPVYVKTYSFGLKKN